MRVQRSRTGSGEVQVQFSVQDADLWGEGTTIQGPVVVVQCLSHVAEAEDQPKRQTGSRFFSPMAATAVAIVTDEETKQGTYPSIQLHKADSK